jgi:hypothetical protein
MADDARRYWEAVAAGDLETANALARRVVESLMSQAHDAESQGKRVLPTALRQEARQIERGELAPYPRESSFPMSSADISRLEPGHRVMDLHGDEWTVAAHPSHDPLMTGRPQAWSVGVTRLRDGVFTRIDSRNQWTLSVNGRKNGDTQ